jgi:hypothetical protein
VAFKRSGTVRESTRLIRGIERGRL